MAPRGVWPGVAAEVNADFVLSARTEMRGIALRGMPAVTRAAAEDRREGPGHEPPHDRRRGLVLAWRLSCDALIEFVIRRWLGLGSNRSLPASGARPAPQ
jgi:hypothetical protein